MNREYLRKLACGVICCAVGSLMAVSCSEEEVLRFRRADFSRMETVRFNHRTGKRISLDSIVSGIRFVRLETRPGYVVVHPDVVNVFDDAILFADKTATKKVLLFNPDGSFKTPVSSSGKASYQYLNLDHVLVTPNGEIGIQENERDKIMVYDHNGRYLRIMDNIIDSRSVEFIGENHLLHCVNGKHTESRPRYDSIFFLVTDIRTKDCYAFGKRMEIRRFPFVRERNTFHSGNRSMGVLDFENIIYDFTPEGVMAKYRMEITPELLTIDRSFNMKPAYFYLLENMPFFEGNFLQMKDCSIFQYIMSDGRIQTLIYRHSDRTTFGLSSSNMNPLFNVPFKASTVYNDSVLVLSCQPNDLLKKREGILGFYGEESGWESLFDGLKPADNPILLFVTLDIDRM